jgi:hypothetical protein
MAGTPASRPRRDILLSFFIKYSPLGVIPRHCASPPLDERSEPEFWGAERNEAQFPGPDFVG